MLELYFQLKKKLKKYFGNVDIKLNLIQMRLDTMNTKFDDLKVKLDGINLRLIIIEGKEDNIMSQVAQDFESLRTAIDEATNAVASKIAVLSGKIANSMTDAEVATLKSEFGAVSDRLTALASDPADPVPVV